MGSPLTTDEQAKILRYLGFANWEDLAASFQLGYPAEGQPESLVRRAFVRISGASLDLVRKDLCELESIEAQIRDARSRLKVAKIGELEVRQDEISALRDEERYWRRRLGDDLGVYENPWSAVVMNNGGRSGRVIG